MRTFAYAVATALFVVLAVVIPIRGVLRIERIRDEIARDAGARRRYYRRSNVLKAALAALAGLLYFANGRRGYGLELLNAQAVWYIALVVGVLVVSSFVLDRRLARPAVMEKARTALAANPLIPETPAERRSWITFSVIAGIAEELLYRGFVLLYLHRVFPHATAVLLVVVSATIFGLAHAYQGRRGIIATAIVGVSLGAVALEAGLLAAMLFHALLDLRILVVLKSIDARQSHDTDGQA